MSVFFKNVITFLVFLMDYNLVCSNFCHNFQKAGNYTSILLSEHLSSYISNIIQSNIFFTKDSIEAAINSVRDLEITDFAAEEIDLQVSPSCRMRRHSATVLNGARIRDLM